jgi:hypothetical protein
VSREIPGGVRVGAYVLGLAVAFGAAYGVGQAVGPLDVTPAEEHSSTPTHEGVDDGH